MRTKSWNFWKLYFKRNQDRRWITLRFGFGQQSLDLTPVTFRSYELMEYFPKSIQIRLQLA